MRHLVLRCMHQYVKVPAQTLCQSKIFLIPTLSEQANRKFQTFGVKLDSKNAREAENQEADEDEEDLRKNALKNALSTTTYFDSKTRNKETFEVMLDIYKQRNPNERGVVEFIIAAMNHLEDYNVQYDIDIYKKLIKLMPEGKFVPTSMWQEEFRHFPKHQDCIINLLDSMEKKGVCPDKDMVVMLRKRFGNRGGPVYKALRQLYWMPKFKKANPWPIPFPPVTDPFLLAKLAIERMCTADPQSVVSVWQSKSIPDAIDDTYIVSGQSPKQKRLLAEHSKEESLFIEGPFHVWLGKGRLNYFMLRADPKELNIEPQDPDDVSNFSVPYLWEKPDAVMKIPSVHEQQDGTILAVCATGTSSRDALLSWIRLLEQHGNPDLAEIPVVFSLKAPRMDVVSADGDGPISGDETEKISH